MKKLFFIVMAFLFTTLLVSCGNKNVIKIWVGQDQSDVVKEITQKYIKEWEQKDKDKRKYPYKLDIRVVDLGSAAATVQTDPHAAGDIIAIPHDNLAKLYQKGGTSNLITPLRTKKLIDQVKADNPDAFLDIIKTTNSKNEEIYLGVPFASQTLVLYYNKKYISDEQVKTWEGILAAAKAKGGNTKALKLVGEDGFNNSFLTLAKNLTTGKRVAKIYEGEKHEIDFSSDDAVSVMKWAQRFAADNNGWLLGADGNWHQFLKNESVLATISGAWNLNAAKESLGENLGIAELPNFTITSEDAYGSTPANTVFQSGTFSDAKLFVINSLTNKYPEKRIEIENIISVLSNSEAQLEGYKKAKIMPSYKNAFIEFEEMKTDKFAIIHAYMFQLGIPQPFSKNLAYNLYYYSKGAPELLVALIRNNGNEYTDEKILETLKTIEKIWKTGKK